LRPLKWFLAGVLSLAIVAVCAALIFLKIQADGFSARAKPSAIEATIARFARNMALPSNAKARRNPVPDTSEVLSDARAHWADHCAICHDNDGSGHTTMGENMYPPAPDMVRGDTQNLTDGELFWIIGNGVRFTGMPAWGQAAGSANSAHSEEDSWKLVRFIRHLPNLTFEEKMQMEKLNPKGPEERKEEEEEEKFLSGEDVNAQETEHHR